MDLFSGFDEAGSYSWIVIWSAVIFHGYWPQGSSLSFSSISMLTASMVSPTKASKLGGFPAISTMLITSLVALNLIGMAPYCFSATSHLALNLGITFSLWFSVVLASSFFDAGGALAHLVPEGAPKALIPFLSLVELTGLSIRPFTLAIRLSANISAGHTLIALSSDLTLLVLFIGTFYFLFEMCVCLIQSYIFTFLPLLYADEHPWGGKGAVNP